MENKKKTIHVRIVTPKELIFDDEAYSLSSKNSQGKFDILPMHANFITLIENVPISIQKTDKKILTFNFPMAIIYNRENVVDIYTNIQIPREELEK